MGKLRNYKFLTNGGDRKKIARKTRTKNKRKPLKHKN